MYFLVSPVPNMSYVIGKQAWGKTRITANAGTVGLRVAWKRRTRGTLIEIESHP